MKPLRFHLAAEQELHEIRRYYEAEQPGLGDRWMKAAEEAAQFVQENPARGRRARFGTRQYRLKGFPYYLIFIERDADLFVVTFMHVRRDPNYWIARL